MGGDSVPLKADEKSASTLRRSVPTPFLLPVLLGQEFLPGKEPLTDPRVQRGRWPPGQDPMGFVVSFYLQSCWESEIFPDLTLGIL